MMLSIDTETTGIDVYHSARPFFVTLCNEEMEQTYYEWEIDPLTRMPYVDAADIEEIASILETADEIILQNPKFDVIALRTIGLQKWDWLKTRDTLRAGHLLASNLPHNLTAMSMQYLGIDIQWAENDLEKACKEARRIVQQAKLKTKRKNEKIQFSDWCIATEGMEILPSAKVTAIKQDDGKDRIWKHDMWLPKAIASELKYPKDHPWWNVLKIYSNLDSAVTIQLWKAQRKEIERRGLMQIYNHMNQLPKIIADMEWNGVSGSLDRMDELEQEFREESERNAAVCLSIAEDYHYPLELPKSGMNHSLKNFCFGKEPGLDLPILKKTESGNPSFDQYIKEMYLLTLDPRTKQYTFVRNLATKSKRDTALNYIESYRKFLLPWNQNDRYFLIHPSLNSTGTDTLRGSSANPNVQQISKKEGVNLRRCFGPLPGEEFWCFDAKNIELRLPAFKSGQQEMIDLFLHPNDPPYFGSNHLLMAHILYPKEFEACRNDRSQIDGRIFKNKYVDTYYQWVKNGDFAVTYGAVAESGTADRAYHLPGAQRIIEGRFDRMKQLNQDYIRFANKHGYVETFPDRTVDPKRGYPLLCSRSRFGKVSPTIPFNYAIQGTAMWWTWRGMIELDKLFDGDRIRYHGVRIVIQVHDEIVVVMPYRSNAGNLPIAREIANTLEKIGQDLIPAVPTPVSIVYVTESWDKGITYA